VKTKAFRPTVGVKMMLQSEIVENLQFTQAQQQEELARLGSAKKRG